MADDPGQQAAPAQRMQHLATVPQPFQPQQQTVQEYPPVLHQQQQLQMPPGPPRPLSMNTPSTPAGRPMHPTNQGRVTKDTSARKPHQQSSFNPATLKDMIIQKEIENGKLKSQNDYLRQCYDEEVHKSRVLHLRAKSTWDEEQAEKNALIENKAKLEEERNALIENNAKLEEEKNALERDVKRKQTIIERYKSEEVTGITDVPPEIAMTLQTLQHEKSQLQKEVDALKATVQRQEDDKDKTIAQLRRDNNQLSATHQSEKTTVSEAKRTIAVMEEEQSNKIAAIWSELMASREEAREAAEHQDRLHKTNTELNTELTASKAIQEAAAKEHQNASVEWNEEISELNSELAAAKTREEAVANRHQSDIADAKKLINVLECQVTAAALKLETVQAERETDVTQGFERLEESNVTISALRTNVDKLKNDNAEALRSIKGGEEAVAREQTKLKTTMDRLTIRDRDILAAHKQTERLNTELEKQKEAADEVYRTFAITRNRHETFQNTSRRESATLRKQVEDMTTRHTSRTAEINDLHQKLAHGWKEVVFISTGKNMQNKAKLHLYGRSNTSFSKMLGEFQCRQNSKYWFSSPLEYSFASKNGPWFAAALHQKTLTECGVNDGARVWVRLTPSEDTNRKILSSSSSSASSSSSSTSSMNECDPEEPTHGRGMKGE